MSYGEPECSVGGRNRSIRPQMKAEEIVGFGALLTVALACLVAGFWIRRRELAALAWPPVRSWADTLSRTVWRRRRRLARGRAGFAPLATALEMWRCDDGCHDWQSGWRGRQAVIVAPRRKRGTQPPGSRGKASVVPAGLEIFLWTKPAVENCGLLSAAALRLGRRSSPVRESKNCAGIASRCSGSNSQQ